MNRILVVCVGNICRSPMAQGLLAHGLPEFEVTSAGTHAVLGAPAEDTAIRLMAARGISIRDHRAVQLNRSMCLSADLVLVMDGDQKREIEANYPQARGRVFRLGEHIKEDIPDPYRQPEEAFVRALQLIEQGTGEWVRRIAKAAAPKRGTNATRQP